MRRCRGRSRRRRMNIRRSRRSRRGGVRGGGGVAGGGGEEAEEEEEEGSRSRRRRSKRWSRRRRSKRWRRRRRRIRRRRRRRRRIWCGSRFNEKQINTDEMRVEVHGKLRVVATVGLRKIEVSCSLPTDTFGLRRERPRCTVTPTVFVRIHLPKDYQFEQTLICCSRLCVVPDRTSNRRKLVACCIDDRDASHIDKS